jgi:protein translocase SecG subunit
LGIFITVIQIITALVLIVLLAVQTDKADQSGGGVMGLGAAGGRTSSNIDLPVGAERILKPLTVWVAMGFLASSVLNAIPQPTWVHFIGVLAVYLLAMIFGNTVWRIVTGAFR